MTSLAHDLEIRLIEEQCLAAVMRASMVQYFADNDATALTAGLALAERALIEQAPT